MKDRDSQGLGRESEKGIERETGREKVRDVARERQRGKDFKKEEKKLFIHFSRDRISNSKQRFLPADGEEKKTKSVYRYVSVPSLRLSTSYVFIFLVP